MFYIKNSTQPPHTTLRNRKNNHFSHPLARKLLPFFHLYTIKNIKFRKKIIIFNDKKSEII